MTTINRLIRWLKEPYYEPVKLSPRMNFGPEAPGLEPKRQAQRQWMASKGIWPKEAQRV